MAEYSSSVDDDPNQINSDCDFMSFLKFPFEDCKSKEIMNNIESKYLLWTGDGQLLWVRYSLDSAPAVTDSSSSLVVIRSKDPHDGNIITLSSYENFSVCEDEVPDEYDINTDVDNMLKVEDRVKVYDAILAPAEKQASVKCKKRVSSREDEEQIGSYVCDLCGSSFVRAVQYYGHLHLHSGDYLWECRLCPEGSRFGSQFQLRRHEKRYHVNLRPHTCSQCGASFDRPSQLDYHKRRIHEGERPHSCQLCGKAFFKHSDLRTHLNTHLSVHGSMCEICGRRFSHISNLTRHIRIHSGVKPYPCSVCGRRFNQLNSLNEHKAVHVNWVPVSCCGKVFKTQVMFRKHLKSVHQTNNMLQQACVTKRQFHCKVCGCSFPFLTLLRKHEMKHNQFACSGCKKDLKSLAELKDHSCSKEKVLEAEDECEFNYEQDINDRQILGDMYLDSDTDWINPQGIVRSGSEKFDESISPLREVQYALSCDILDESAPLCCTEVDMELKGQVQACKPVENTCCEVSLDDSAEEVKSIITPLDAVNSGLLMVIPQTLPEHSPNYTSQLTCDSFVSPSVFEHSIPSGGTDSLDGYSINEYSAAVIVKEADKCLTNGKGLDDNYINESNSERVAEECPSDGSNKPVNVEISSKKHKDKNCNDDKTTKRYTCSVCNKQFLKACNFRQHQGIHDIGRQLYRCKVCGRSFAWKSTLNKHVLSHSENPNPTIFMCHMCDKLYTSSSVLQAHINRDHLKKRPHICSVCKKSFFKKYDLKIHLRTHTNERPYICGTCGRGFGHISHLIRHERIHSGQRPYQCSFCPASFIQSSSLTSHQKHHVNKPDHSVCYLEFVMERPKSNES